MPFNFTFGPDVYTLQDDDKLITALAGDDSVTGSNTGESLIYGNLGNDSIIGAHGTTDSGDSVGGDDTVSGGVGKDFLNFGWKTNKGRNLLNGNEGDDEIHVSTNDIAGGNKSNDMLDASFGGGNNQLFGGPGSDVLSGFKNDVLYGQDGDDHLLSVLHSKDPSDIGGSNYLYGGYGYDLLEVYAGDNSTLEGNQGNDNLFAEKSKGHLLNGNEDDDVLTVDRVQQSRLIGDLGTDELYSIAGTGNFLEGSAGNDYLESSGSSTGDTLDGGESKDEIQSDRGNQNWLIGSFGDDTLGSFTSKGDILDAGDGNDQLTIDSSEKSAEENSTNSLASSDTGDTLAGGNAAYGKAGFDLMYCDSSGNGPADSLIGGSGNDTLDASLASRSTFLNGNIDNDILKGGNGNDSLTGGAGIEELTGGAGSDMFFYRGVGAGGSGETITDFNPADDKIYLSPLGFGIAELAAGTTSPLNPAAFLSVTTSSDIDSALNPGSRIIYVTSTGDVYSDRDGNGISDPALLVTLSNKPSQITADNFALYA